MAFRIEHFKTISSTNTVALERGQQGEEEGLVLRADFQTSGHGKDGHKWISPAGKNLLFSLLIRPNIPPNRAPMLTQVACRSVAKVLKDHYDISSTFKRPNDILVGGKKISGILVETMSTSSGNLEFAVIGIGLNVDSKPSKLVSGATSMTAVSDKKIEKDLLLSQILRRLEADLESIHAPTP